VAENDTKLTVFRVTDGLRKRLDAAVPSVARALDQPEKSITGQLEIVWLLNYAMDRLDVPRETGPLEADDPLERR